MLKTSTAEAFIQQKNDPTLKRAMVLGLALLLWWIGEYRLNPLLGSTFSRLRASFGAGQLLWSHILPSSLPVFFLGVIGIVALNKATIIPAPRFLSSWRLILREGFMWGLLACLPVVPLALSMGFHLGFQPEWQKILGNVVSNSYEEIVYRVFLLLVAAYAFRRLSLAVIFVALLFGFVHTQYPTSMQVLVGLASVFFSLAYLRSNTVLAAIVAHQLADMILDSILLQ